jgi:hypothetical protein
VSARLIEAAKAIDKARQLTSLNDVQRAALCVLSSAYEAQEILYREEVARIIALGRPPFA